MNSESGSKLAPPKLKLRPAEESELNFLRNSWFKSYRASVPDIRQDVYDEEQNKLIERLLKKHPPIVATLEAVPDEIVAWACREFHRPVTHYIYVKQAYRRIGVGSVLAAATDFYTHYTRAGVPLALRVGARYNHYLLQEQK